MREVQNKKNPLHFPLNRCGTQPSRHEYPVRRFYNSPYEEFAIRCYKEQY